MSFSTALRESYTMLSSNLSGDKSRTLHSSRSFETDGGNGGEVCKDHQPRCFESAAGENPSR